MSNKFKTQPKKRTVQERLRALETVVARHHQDIQAMLKAFMTVKDEEE